MLATVSCHILTVTLPLALAKRKRRSKIADSSDEDDEATELSHDLEKNTIESQSSQVEAVPATKKVKVEDNIKEETEDASVASDEDEEIEQAKREEEEADREMKEDKAVAKKL